MPWESLGAGLFGGAEVEVPATTQEVIDALRVSMEAVVKGGRTRVDVELPPGLRLGGVEGALDPLAAPAGELPPERLARADRDLARYVARLLEPVQQRLCVAFRTSALVREAQAAWKAAGTGGRLLAFGGGGGKRSAFGAAGSGSERLRRALAETRCEYLAVVAPRTRQLPALAEICEELGSEVRIVLLNARLRGRSLEGDTLRGRLAAEFDPAFHLQLFGGAGQDGLLFRALRPEGATPWVVAQRRLAASADGEGEEFSAQIVSRSVNEPAASEVMAALGVSG